MTELRSDLGLGLLEALRQSEETYRTLFKSSPHPRWIYDTETLRILAVNDAALTHYGFSESEFLARTIRDLRPGEEVPRLLERLSKQGNGVYHSGPWRHRKKDGTTFLVEITSHALDFAGRRARVVEVNDITERERTEKALQDQNWRLGLLNEAAVQLLASDEPESAMAKVYERIAGYFQTSDFFEFDVEETGDGLRVKSCVRMGEPQRECAITRLRMDEGIIGTVARRRQPIVLERVQQSEDPKATFLKELGIQAYACYPLIVGERLLGTLSFASRQRKSFEVEDLEFFQTLASYRALAKERLRLREQLERHAANLEATVKERTGSLQEMVAELEHLSYSIIHDMRAPLRAIRSFAALISQQEGQHLNPSSLDLFERIMAATDRMDLLITGVVSYSRAMRQEMKLEPVALGEVLRDIIRSYPELEPGVAEVRLEGEFPLVLGNKAGLTQCFSNLLNNAVKFVKAGEKSRVRVWAEVTGQPAVARVWIEDNGTGIPRDGQQKIFQMFHRMHGKEYEGTGMGLALVRKVVERMGGRVGVESEPGKGSRFWLELPLAASREVPERQQAA